MTNIINSIEYTHGDKMKKLTSLDGMIKTALLIALCFISVYVNIPIPSPSGGGLMHLGGVILFLAAIYLGPFQAGLVGGVGMGLFDLLSPYAIWFPCTLLTRFIMGYVSGKMIEKDKNLILSMSVGSIIMIIGYYIYGVILEENLISPLYSVIGDSISSIFTIVIVIAILPFTNKVFRK